MRFAFKSALQGMLFEQKFAETVGSLVEAFVVRSRTD
jgi:ribosome-associated toxin RatA of RatAB toxin-antitoxin module